MNVNEIKKEIEVIIKRIDKGIYTINEASTWLKKLLDNIKNDS